MDDPAKKCVVCGKDVSPTHLHFCSSECCFNANEYAERENMNRDAMEAQQRQYYEDNPHEC